MNLVAARRLQCEIQCIGNVFSPHVSAELPGDDVAAVVVEDRAEIEPAPAQYWSFRGLVPVSFEQCLL